VPEASAQKNKNCKKQMRVLELFKGTGSVGKVLEQAGHEVVSLDILAKFNPTHICDIMDFEYRQYQPKHFDIVWASPECKVYSQLQTTNVGATRKYKCREELDQARRDNSKYVEKVLEIIQYLDPDEWYIENPYYSAMKDLACMKSLASHRFDYCRFGTVYKKPTRVWSNRTDLENHVCTCTTKRHLFKLGIARSSMVVVNQETDVTNAIDRYRIPEGLVKHIFSKHLL
jgi:hypothetical protein